METESSPRPTVPFMSIWNILVGLFHRSAQAAVAGPAKAVTGVVKDVSGVTKDVTGIQKDRVETKLAKLELKEKTSLVHVASFSDVRQYDPKVKNLIHHLECCDSIRESQASARVHWRYGLTWPIILLPLVVAGILLWIGGIKLFLFVFGGFLVLRALLVGAVRIYRWILERRSSAPAG